MSIKLLHNRYAVLVICLLIGNFYTETINCYKIENNSSPTSIDMPTKFSIKNKRYIDDISSYSGDNHVGNNSERKQQILSDSEIFNRDLFDQLTTNNPCLVHYCPKGRECVINGDQNEPICVCQRYCSHRKRSICGSNGQIYKNHCELHRAACITNQPITYQRMEKCSNTKKSFVTITENPTRNLTFNQIKTTLVDIFKPSQSSSAEQTSNTAMNYKDQIQSPAFINNQQDNTTILIPQTYPNMNLKSNILRSSSSTLSVRPFSNNNVDKSPEIVAPSELQNRTGADVEDDIAGSTTNDLFNQIDDTDQSYHNKKDFNFDSAPGIATSNNDNVRKDYCSSQEYEIMKDNLLLYSHARLMSQDNNHSKDFLVSIMFSHYDQNNNAHLEVEELNQISLDEHLEELSNGCILADMLNFDDTNYDGKLSINEFYQAFSKLYSVSVVSLDKALETNHLSARVGDNVEIKCDVTGSPSPPLIWRRNGIELSSLNEEEIRVFSDGSLYLTRIQLYHSGNYSCHAQRNKDVVQTHILNVYTVPEVRVMPRIQSKRPGENADMSCHITGDPFPKVEWLKNDEPINLNIQDKYEIIGNGTSLKINNIAYSDTGAYMCQATNIGGSVRDISSLIVQEEPTPTVFVEERKFFVFHEFGIAIYEPSACRLHHQIQSTDIIPGTQEYVCGTKNVKCSWGRAINVGTRYIYASQPNRDRILVISIIQMVVVDVISTDKYPVELFYVARLDQVWLLCWHQFTKTTTTITTTASSTTPHSSRISAINKNNNNENIQHSKTIQVIRDAGQKRKHHTVHPEPIDGQYDLIKDFFIPSGDLEQPHYSYKYGYVTHNNQRGLYKLDLTNLRYTKSVDLTMYNCVPEKLDFSALYGYVIMSCREPITNRPQGQLILDYLTDSVLSTKPTLLGSPKISPDSRHLVTIQHKPDGVVCIVIQKVTAAGLEFLFDVKTTLNISDLTFYESQSMHGYDLFASAAGKEDILYLNLYTGKVEMITGVGPSMPIDLVKWDNPARLIRASGLFGQYMVTPANNALFIINGKARTVNCEIGGILHPVSVVWVHNMAPSYTVSSSAELLGHSSAGQQQLHNSENSQIKQQSSISRNF